MQFASATLLTNGTMSASLNSFGIDTSQKLAVSIQALWNQGGFTTSALGTLKLQGSNDNATVPESGSPGTDPAVNVVNWTDLPGTLSSTSSLAGSSSFMWTLSLPGFRWIRMAFVTTSGSGNLSAQYFGKGG